MSTRLQAPPVPPPVPAAPSPERVPDPPSDTEGSRNALLLPLLLLLAAAILPLGRVFVGWSFVRPVLSAVLIAVGLSWGCRRYGAGPILALVVSVVGWAVFVSAAFLGGTTVFVLVPTTATLEAFGGLWAHGFQLIGTRPPPTFAEPSLLLVTVTGVWAMTHAIDGITFRLGSPARAVLPALGMWLVPLLLTVDGRSPARWTVPFLAAAALLVLVSSSIEVSRWGQGAPKRDAPPSTGILGTLLAPGALIAGAAIVAGVTLAANLPGFDDPPWYEFGGVGGTTLTTNPIVSIRPSLVATDQGTVMRVTTPRPVYLRTTSLDVYSDTGEWTNAGIRGNPVGEADGNVRSEDAFAAAQALDVGVEITDLPGAVLVPAPYQPRAVTGEAAGGFQYDPRLATLTTERGTTLEPGDRYRVSAAVPDPNPGTIRELQASPRPENVELPPNVPGEVADLARSIVEQAGAHTSFEQALAIQEEFQSGAWEYSLTPPPGHSGDAMLAFITSRIGYCEQYAGTMAVMLRTLGVPARVAVGFTPGEQVADGVYEVTNANAHAWVEVLFPGHGWLAFEPTPRDDGNVLPPTVDDLAPELTVQEQAAAESIDVPETAPEQELLPEEELPAFPDDTGSASSGGAAGDDRWGPTRWLLAVVVALVGVCVLMGVAYRRLHVASTATPLARVLAARRRVERVGRGLGIGTASWETDQEYLLRLTAVTASPHAPAAAILLAGRLAQARYSPRVPEVSAREAETAAGALRDALIAGRSMPGRAAILLRGTLAAAAARLPVAVSALPSIAGQRLRRRSP